MVYIVVLWQKGATLENTFLVNEQNVSVMHIDIMQYHYNYLDLLDIFQQAECFCSKLEMEVEHAKSNLKITFL